MKNQKKSFTENSPIGDIPSKHIHEKGFHCGEDCPDMDIKFDEKYFCCNCCQTVYQLLNKTGWRTVTWPVYGIKKHAPKIQRKIMNGILLYINWQEISPGLFWQLPPQTISRKQRCFSPFDTDKNGLILVDKRKLIKGKYE